ncbi:hypothetical protein W822_15580 [Advenella kashmirensis W13003]|uniref:Uncharacterized protein n=1 Tax=Advenella kashmirensis W13003 TaxID=1424334 RepID=V8QR16_9BURK|nr:hypothetical protein [Advenella kashmirensis]ETF02421.1 hypothetical protein W822_15580 [Advenella kashmirensis W13003]
MAEYDYTKMSEIELIDHIDWTSKFIDSMLCMCTGAGFDGFKDQNDEIQHDYLFAINNLSIEMRRAIKEQGRRRSFVSKKAA